MKIRLRNPGWVGFRDLFIQLAIMLCVFMLPISFTLSWGLAVLYMHDRGLIPEDGAHEKEMMVLPPTAFIIFIILAVLCQGFVERKNWKAGAVKKKVRALKDVVVDESHLDRSWEFP